MQKVPIGTSHDILHGSALEKTLFIYSGMAHDNFVIDIIFCIGVVFFVFHSIETGIAEKLNDVFKYAASSKFETILRGCGLLKP
jgi:hypothetical protein